MFILINVYFIAHLRIEEISRRLRTGDLGIPDNPEDRFEKYWVINLEYVLLASCLCTKYF